MSKAFAYCNDELWRLLLRRFKPHLCRVEVWALGPTPSSKWLVVRSTRGRRTSWSLNYFVVIAEFYIMVPSRGGWWVPAEQKRRRKGFLCGEEKEGTEKRSWGHANKTASATLIPKTKCANSLPAQSNGNDSFSSY